MGINAYHRAELKGIRTTTCPDCDGSGEDGDSGEGFWEMSDCQKCHGTGEFYACHECGENEAVCDDYCVECHVAFMLADPDEFDATESHWQLPGFKDALEQINAALAAKGSK